MAARPNLTDTLGRLEKVEKKVSAQKSFNPAEHKDKTRSTIAKIFTWGYLALVGVVIVGLPIYNALTHTSCSSSGCS